MSGKMSQNIFDYATSELSQDAFISLLVSWYDSEDKKLKEMSFDFISRLYAKYHADILEDNNVPKLDIKSIEIKQQHYKIDVFFEITFNDDTKIPFIIEDKTWTEPHGGQLLRYAEKVNNQNTIKVFFKTGHITEKDKSETSEAKYIILDVKWIYDFLMEYENDIDNIIYKDYLEYLNSDFYSKLYNPSNGNKLDLSDWKKENLKEGYVQYSIIEHIKKNIDSQNSPYIKYTKNGKQWDTWWSFCKTDLCHFFVKIKKIGKNYRLRLIEYSNKDFSSDSKKTSTEYHMEIINIILKDRGISNIETTPKVRYKARETEIAFVDILDDNLEKYTEDFSILIQNFIEKLDTE